MSVKTRILAAAATLTLLGGAGVAASGAAEASSPGCAFTNGCATLHGVDGAGHAVAMDAKRQSKASGTLIIGWADVPGDVATSWDAVLHYTSSAKVTTYADTGLQVKDFDNTCHTPVSHDVTPTVTGSGGATGAITAGGNDLAVSSGVSDLSISGGGTGTLNWTGVGTSAPQDLRIAETYGAGCVSLWGVDVFTASGVATFGPFSIFAASTNGHIHEQDTGSSVDTFTDSVAGGVFTFTGLPSGISQSGGVLTADTSTAIPNTYTSVGVVYTEPGGVIDTASFTLVVTGNKTVGPGPDVPYYTFVYAPNGDWTSECVTDNNGSGALTLQACTLGKNRYQDWFALDGAGNPSSGLATSSAAFRVQNVLAAVTNAASSCLTDPSALNPATPQSDATDENASPAGRQLRTDGSCALGVNPWTWAS
jgi:hypothetical protein